MTTATLLRGVKWTETKYGKETHFAATVAGHTIQITRTVYTDSTTLEPVGGRCPGSRKPRHFSRSTVFTIRASKDVPAGTGWVSRAAKPNLRDCKASAMVYARTNS